MLIGCFNLVHYRRLKMTIGFDHHPFVGSKRANAGITTKRKMLYDNGGDAPMNLDGLGDRLKRLRKSHGISQDMSVVPVCETGKPESECHPWRM